MKQLVANRLFLSPAKFVSQWPEIFNELYMNFIPVTYVHLVNIEFYDGSVWEIDIADQLETHPADQVSSFLQSSLREFGPEIKDVDFKLDIEKLKRDTFIMTSNVLV
jgi:hypothetical protein